MKDFKARQDSLVSDDISGSIEMRLGCSLL